MLEWKILVISSERYHGFEITLDQHLEDWRSLQIVAKTGKGRGSALW